MTHYGTKKARRASVDLTGYVPSLSSFDPRMTQLLGVWQWFWVWPFTLVAGILSLLGCYDLWQKSHAVLRNYPVIAHIRYPIEAIRPEIRQYLLEADTEKLPFSRSQRSLVYARAKNEVGDRPFGTLIARTRRIRRSG